MAIHPLHLKSPIHKIVKAIHETQIDIAGKTARTDIARTEDDIGVALHLPTEIAHCGTCGGTTMTE